MQRRRLFLSFWITMAVMVAGSGYGQVTSTWNTTSGNFSNAANWDITQVPVSTDAGYFETNATYQVDFTRNETNSQGRVLAGNVTFNMNGFRYLDTGLLGYKYAYTNAPNYWSTDWSLVTTGTVNEATPSFVITNAALTVTGGGTLEVRSGAYFGYDFYILGGGSLIVTGGTTVVATGGGHQGFGLRGGSLTVDGAGSKFLASGGPYGPGLYGDVTVQNGGLYSSSDGINNNDGTHTILVTGSGSKVYAAGLQTGYGGTMIASVTNGAEMWLTAYSSLSGNSGAYNGNQIWVGGPGASSLIVASNTIDLSYATLDYYGVSSHITVLSNGTLRLVGGGTGVNIGDGASGSYMPASSVNLRDGGLIQIGAGKVINVLTNDQPAFPNDVPTLRGAGTISKFDAGANFAIVNSGILRVGDTGLGTNNTPGLGVLNLVGGNLMQTNPGQGRIYFGFSDTALDQINISGGLALINTGTNWFSLASGAPTPLPGVKYGLGAYDFIIGTNVTYTPQYDNMISNLTAWGLVQNVDYRWGVVDLGNGLQALELAFVPEPSTVLLLVGGGLVLWRVRRRQ